MKKELILKEIYRQNLFWNKDNKEIFYENKTYQRKLFFVLQKYLDKRQMLSIIGLRRVGKTILLKQLIKSILEESKTNPQNILFLSFDAALVSEKLSLNDYLSVYLENICPEKTKKIYIFIDEIQYIDNWQHILKRYYDTAPNIKFVVSGSSSLFIQKKTTESLVGRIYEFKLNFLEFIEYLELTKEDKEFISAYSKIKLDLKKLNLDKIESNHKLIENFLGQYGDKANKCFFHYLTLGQFPESALEPNYYEAGKYLKESVYKKTIEYDIPRIFGVDNIDKLKFVYEILINETGNQIELQNIASETGITYKTLSNYLNYFKESLLVDVVYGYTKSFRKSRRSIKKSYIASTNFYPIEINSDQSLLINQAMGHLAETYAFNTLKNHFNYIAVYRQRDKEIDFVATNNLLNKNDFLFVEVKYRENVKIMKFDYLKKIASKMSSRPFLILTKNEFFIEKNGLAIPLYLIS